MLKDQIDSELKRAMRSGDTLRLSVFRMVSSALHNREIEKRTRLGGGNDAALADEESIQVLRSELKKRKDAAEAYAAAGRSESAAQERAEADIISSLLPQELSDDEIGLLVHEGMQTLGITSPKEFGQLMGWVMARIAGRASGERVSARIKREFTPLQNSEG